MLVCLISAVLMEGFRLLGKFEFTFKPEIEELMDVLELSTLSVAVLPKF